MQTWIVNIEHDEAQILAVPDGESSPHPVVRHRREGNHRSYRAFLRYVAEELEIACGAGTDSHVVLLAPAGIVRMMKRILSPGVRDRIVEDIGHWFVDVRTKRQPAGPVLN